MDISLAGLQYSPSDLLMSKYLRTQLFPHHKNKLAPKIVSDEKCITNQDCYYNK